MELHKIIKKLENYIVSNTKLKKYSFMIIDRSIGGGFIFLVFPQKIKPKRFVKEMSKIGFNAKQLSVGYDFSVYTYRFLATYNNN